MLDDKSVDVVFIAAPNHWHALAAIWAMQAGKDVYVEKPVSHNVSEGRRIVQVARKTGPDLPGRDAESIQRCAGGGHRLHARRQARRGEAGPQHRLRPARLDRRTRHVRDPRRAWTTTSGPARRRWSRSSRPKFHYDWHWFWNTGNGELGNNNIHSLDICRWGLGVTGLGRAVLSYGGRLGYSDAGQTPNTQVVVFDFGDKTIVSETRGLKTEPFHPDFKGGWIFFGTEGIIAGTSLFDPEGKLVRTFDGKSENHFANFLKAVRSRKVSDLNADILEGHQSTALCHIGNISYRLGRPGRRPRRSNGSWTSSRCMTGCGRPSNAPANTSPRTTWTWRSPR